MTAAADTVSLHDTVTNRIIRELEQGRFPWVQPWASSGTTPLGLPLNASTGRAYSGVNILLLWVGRHRAGQAVAALAHLQAGARRSAAPCARARRGRWSSTPTPSSPRPSRRRRAHPARTPARVGFLKRFTVFHVDQCDGLPPDPDATPLAGADRGPSARRSCHRRDGRRHPDRRRHGVLCAVT